MRTETISLRDPHVRPERRHLVHFAALREAHRGSIRRGADRRRSKRAQAYRSGRARYSSPLASRCPRNPDPPDSRFRVEESTGKASKVGAAGPAQIRVISKDAGAGPWPSLCASRPPPASARSRSAGPHGSPARDRWRGYRPVAAEAAGGGCAAGWSARGSVREVATADDSGHL